MAREPAPTRLTGGAGYGFEDPVAAWVLAHLLTGQHVLAPMFSSVKSVSWQARGKGWLCDDLVVTFIDAKGISHTAAYSIKSDRQITSGGFPSAFVHDVWEQWLREKDNPFQRDNDVFVLTVGIIGSNVETEWSDLLNEALETKTSPASLVQRLVTPGMESEVKQRLFYSLRCPGELSSGKSISDETVAEVLRHIRVCHFDFRNTPSKDIDRAWAICTEAVESRDSVDAKKLWELLVDFAYKKRNAGGEADLKEILQILGTPALKNHPDFYGDWARMGQIFEETASRIRDSIGGRIQLPRLKPQTDTIAAIGQHRISVLVGQSGSGKSALCKRICQSLDAGIPRVWLDSTILDQAQLSDVAKRLEIKYPIIQLLSALSARLGMVVFDGIGRTGDLGLETACQIIVAVRNNPKWRCIITCTLDGLERFLNALNLVDVQLPRETVVQVPQLSQDELLEVVNAIPGLREFAFRPELGPLLLNPKILDLVVGCLSADKTASQPIANMPDLVDALWARWVRKGHQEHGRAEFLKKIAEAEGDGLSSGVGISTASGATDALENLEKDQILIVDAKHEKIWFSHNLIGDWARLRVLIEHTDAANDWLSAKCVLPRWHSSIRLYGQWLLSQGLQDVAQWQQLVISHNENRLAQNLLLDSVALAVDSENVLPKVWDVLQANNGNLLRRFLKRFLHVTTFPFPGTERIPDDHVRIWAQATFRIPFWPFWLPALYFLKGG